MSPHLQTKRFLKDRRGNVAMLFGLMAIPVFGIIGTAIDYGRAAKTKQELQSLIDGAALAATSEYTKTGSASTASTRLRTFVAEGLTKHDLELLPPPQPGDRIGFEAGRGVGGNSFMDLTGRDPDVAANLLQLTLSAPGTDASLGETPEVALEVRLNDGDSFTLPQSVSPDSDYFWLDRVSPDAVRLEAGEHTLRYGYAGAEGVSNPGISKVDAFVLLPAIGRRVVALPDGRQYALTYDTLTGESVLEETAP